MHVRNTSHNQVTLARRVSAAAGIVIAVVIGTCWVYAAISVSTSATYTQNFDGMGIPATPTTPEVCLKTFGRMQRQLQPWGMFEKSEHSHRQAPRPREQVAQISQLSR